MEKSFPAFSEIGIAVYSIKYDIYADNGCEKQYENVKREFS